MSLSSPILFPPETSRISLRAGRAGEAADADRLSVRERRSSLRLKSPVRRKEFLAGRVVAHRAVRDVLPSAEGVEILPQDDRQATSRPVVTVNGRAAEVEVSITHCAGLVVAAAVSGSGRAGVDLVESGSVTESVQAGWMTDAERAAIARSAFSDQTASMIWAAREAAYKASDSGDGFRPGQWEIHLRGRRSRCFYRGILQPLSFQFFSLSSSLLLAVATVGVCADALQVRSFSGNGQDISCQQEVI